MKYKLTLLAVPAFALVMWSGTPASANGIAAQKPFAGGKSIVQEVSDRRKRRSKRGARASSASAARAALNSKKSAPADTSRLFGTTETQSTNFKAFKKWNGVTAKMAEEQSDTAAFAERFKDWIKFLDTLKGKPQLEQIKAVNSFMNKSKYIQDNKNWGIKDYWASPGEFLSKFGDCEDYSIAKYMALKYLGHDPAKMRIVAVKDLNLKVGHAVLAYYLDDRIVLLDNQIKIVVDSRKVRHYRPVYSINEKAWWRHRAA